MKGAVITIEKLAETLFNYLRDVMYAPKNAVLNVEELPEEFQNFGYGLKFFVECVSEIKTVTQGMSRGEFDTSALSRGNELAAPLKSLVASMKHLTWQAQRIARGDYSQRVDFMGEFSEAFDQMVVQLSERQQGLEDKVNEVNKKSESLEHFNNLLSLLIQHVPHQIFVVDRTSNKVLLANEQATEEINSDSGYLQCFISKSNNNTEEGSNEMEVEYNKDGVVRYFDVKYYLIDWGGTGAKIFVINDTSESRIAIQELETQAYQDNLTGLYNRAYGMKVLDDLVETKSNFVIIFSDLDSLKYVNDEFGHAEGDLYIINASKHLKTFAPDAVVCRLGGDEFMMLSKDVNFATAHKKMSTIYHNFSNDEHLVGKEFTYSISYGLFVVDATNSLSSSEILSKADESMYENKRMRKRERQQVQNAQIGQVAIDKDA